MKLLARSIRNRLKANHLKWGHCAIYEEELQRLWPIDMQNRKAAIEQFAKEHGFRLSYYKRGLCAIFEKN